MSKINVLELAERIPDEAAAYEYLEGLRWDGQPVCPHCDNADRCYFLKPANGARRTRTGSATQRRVWKCGECRKQFSVLTDTIMHGTKIPVRTWVFVMFEMCASKNGVSAREIERKYGVTPRSAWFLNHRIREAMKRGGIVTRMTGTIVADETWIGGAPGNRHASAKKGRRGSGVTDKTPVLTLISRESGEARSHVMERVTGRTLRDAIEANVDMKTTELHTDQLTSYLRVGADVAAHYRVHHNIGQYVSRGGVTTNPAENYFSQLKRSLDGTHHHVLAAHLPRYLAEYDFRSSTREMTDADRMVELVGRVGGRRMTYDELTTATWPYRARRRLSGSVG